MAVALVYHMVSMYKELGSNPHTDTSPNVFSISHIVRKTRNPTFHIYLFLSHQSHNKTVVCPAILNSLLYVLAFTLCYARL